MNFKRWRAYHRGLKRGEGWAIALSKKNPIALALYRLYNNADFKSLVYGENPLMKLIKNSADWVGAYLPVYAPCPSLRKRSQYRGKNR